MSFYTDASLVLIPSGYKDQKVYSAKPVDGSGDLTFSRASSATRVNSSGLVEKVRTNLATYSNDVSNAAWTKLTDGTYTITSETITDPFGNSVAVQKVTLTSGGYLVLRNLLGSATTSPTTGSVYIKKTVSTTSVDTDLSDTGVATSANNTDWQRLVSTNPASVYGSGTFLDINITTVNEPVYVAYAQIELSDFGATDYIGTTSAAVSVGPVSGLPRLDYSGGATCPSLLLEPQRTNLATYSEQFDNWLKFNSSVSSNVIASPSGYVDADKIVEDGSSSYHDIDQTQTYTAAAYTISVFAKSAERNHIFLQHFDGTTFFTSGTFNLSNGTVSGSGSIESYGNGWYRCSFTATTTSGTGKAYINLSNGTTGNYAGDGTSGVYVWGAQLEAGAYATSYIGPTLSTATTRVVDKAEKTSASAIIGQTEGTIFWEIQVDIQSATGNENILTIDDGSTYNNSIYLAKGETGNLVGVIVDGGVVQATFVVSKTTGTFKMALGYANNNSAFFVDGVQVGTTDTSCSIPASLSRITLGNTPLGPSSGPTKQLLLFPTRLSNALLSELTTL